jgi:1-acyl-sn-glycerol-3-phosphate acyltransferase
MKPKDYFYDHPATGPGHFGQVFVSWFFVLVRVVFKLFRFKVVGRRAIQDFKAAQAQLEPKERRNLIIAGNHESYLDPLFVISAIRPDIVRFIVKDDFMDYPVAGRLVAYSGGFPIKRNSADMQAV